jgi:hypothetical protein
MQLYKLFVLLHEGFVVFLHIVFGTGLVPILAPLQAARDLNLNFSKIFYGCYSNNVWHLLVALVCKVRLIW